MNPVNKHTIALNNRFCFWEKRKLNRCISIARYHMVLKVLQSLSLVKFIARSLRMLQRHISCYHIRIKKNRKYTFLRIVGFYFVYIYLCQKTIVVWQNIFIDIYSFFVLSTKLHRIIAFILLHPFKRVCSIGLDITMRFFCIQTDRLHYKSFIIEKKIYKYGFWHLIHLYLFNARLLCVLWIQLLWPFSLFVCNI